MSPSSVRAPHFRREADDSNDSIREQALERVDGGKVENAKTGQRFVRRAYPSDISRRRRTVAVCLDSDEEMAHLRRAAEEVGKALNKSISPTALAALLVSAGLRMLDEQRIHVTTASLEVERLTIEEK